MSKLLVRIIRLYRAMPFTPAACRFIPSCSKYCEESILNHGTISGLWLCVKRILRCNPLLTKELTHNPVE